MAYTYGGVSLRTHLKLATYSGEASIVLTGHNKTVISTIVQKDSAPTMSWLIAVSKPNHEKIAAANLTRQGFEFYYPKLLIQKPNAKAVERPLFPRYIFVLAGSVWRSLTGTRGLSYVLMNEGGPQIISDTVINAIKAREDSSGHFQLIAPPRFVPGDKVKCQEGPLAGLPLIYEGMSGHERAKVLMDFLGRHCVVTVEEKLLTAA